MFCFPNSTSYHWYSDTQVVSVYISKSLWSHSQDQHLHSQSRKSPPKHISCCIARSHSLNSTLLRVPQADAFVWQEGQEWCLISLGHWLSREFGSSGRRPHHISPLVTSGCQFWTASVNPGTFAPRGVPYCKSLIQQWVRFSASQ